MPHVAKLGLDASFATLRLADCDLSLRNQRTTRDVWCVVVGPLGTIAFSIANRAVLERIRVNPRRASATAPTRGSHSIALDADFAVDLELRGARLHGRLVFRDSSLGGGFEAGLPSRGATPWQRLVERLVGQRHRDRAVKDEGRSSPPPILR